MKQAHRNFKTVLILAFVAVGLIGCAKEKAAQQPSTVSADSVPRPPSPPPEPNRTLDANQVALKLVSTDKLEDYANRPVSQPEDVTLTLTLEDFGEGGYGGSMSISYYDGNKYYASKQTTGYRAVDVEYNIWFKKDGNQVWHGFFEDDWGGIVVVIDGVEDLGETQALSGSVWYKNFDFEPFQAVPPNPIDPCWKVKVGPYDCRTFLEKVRNTYDTHDSRNYEVFTTKSVEPDGSGFRGQYRKLATFVGLDRAAAFNE